MRTGVKIAGPIIGAAVIAGVVLVGSATAQPASIDPSWDMHRSVLSRTAANLGVTEARLTESMDQAHGQALDDAVAAGRVTREQADQMDRHHRLMGQPGHMMSGGTMDGMVGSGIAGMMSRMMSAMTGSGSSGAACHGVSMTPSGG